MKRKLLTPLLLICLWQTSLWGQIDGDRKIDVAEFNIIRDRIEELIAAIEEEDGGGFEDNSIYELLEAYLEKPLDLNEASAEILEELRFLSDVQINDFIRYRRDAGAFIALYELQSIPSFDQNTIELLLPFVTVKKGIDDYNVPIGEMLFQGNNTLYARWDRILEEKKGFSDVPDGETATRYLGSPNKFNIRFRHQYETKLSYGFSLEQDAGEPFSGFPGFDFYTAHFFLKDINKTIKGLAIGDYAVNMGQGLIMFDGFGTGKSAFVNQIKKSGRPLRPYTSIGEDLYKRGGAINLNFGKNFEIMAFGSYRQRDANISAIDTTDLDTDILQVSSLQTSGLHRTQAEIDDKNSINHLSTGGTIKYKQKNWHIAANVVYDKFNTPLERNYQTYNQFFFNGDQLLNASLDYSLILRNFNFFGETAISDNGGLASFNGLIIGLDRGVDMSIAYRHYDADYQALYPNVFAETSSGNNERGIYLGIEIQPNKHWSFRGYFDTWRHPWLRSGVDAPSKGHEYLARITYKRKRKMSVYLQFRDEFKERNAKDNVTATDFLVDTRRTQLRLHLQQNVSKALELRWRAEYSRFENGTGGISDGFMLFQDVIYSPIGFPLSFKGRFALFDTDDYDSRIYAYENDILLSFSVPPYYNRGTRFYLGMRYKGIRNMTLELRFAQTYYANQETFGSGLEEIAKPMRSEVKAQIKYKF